MAQDGEEAAEMHSFSGSPRSCAWSSSLQSARRRDRGLHTHLPRHNECLGAYWLRSQLIEQDFGVLEVSRIKALGEPAVDCGQ
jgi:hypothetical protein